MTIEEIKSVSIYQWMKENDYGDGVRKGKSIFYCSPLRPENSPSFAVNIKENLWYDFGSGIGGNLINLVERLHPAWSEHQVLSFLQRQIEEKKLLYSKDYNAVLREEENKRQWLEGKRKEFSDNLNQETFVEMVVPLTHPALTDYIFKRRISYRIAQQFCKEVHYTFRGRRYYAIAFKNVANGMEARNVFCKRCIGKKSISVIYADGSSQQQCCVFEGFFDLLSFLTMQAEIQDNGISINGSFDYFVLNGVGEIKILIPLLEKYKAIHCYLDNDNAGKNATKSIMNAYGSKVIDESYRYREYNDLNDCLMAMHR